MICPGPESEGARLLALSDIHEKIGCSTHFGGPMIPAPGKLWTKN